MSIIYLACFIGGLLLGVRIMIAGVERPREAHPSGERTFRLSPAVVAVAALVFGLAGYLLYRRQVGTEITQILVAAGLAVIASVVTARLVRDWWKVTPEFETDDERYVLQGHVAQVTKPIAQGVDGEVVFELNAVNHVHPARSIDASTIPAGSEVVIERIEDGIAYVESWAEVEKRL
jgi:membrane protein implicated in regulation of membrane protease activity